MCFVFLPFSEIGGLFCLCVDVFSSFDVCVCARACVCVFVFSGAAAVSWMLEQ